MVKTGMPWNEVDRQLEAQDMYDRMFKMKFLPPGRGLWAMGTALTKERRLFAALNNCAFVSTDNLPDNPSGPFCFLMDASMLGVGVGFDTLGAGTITVRSLNPPSEESPRHIVDDSREGWVISLKMLLDAFLLAGSEQKVVPSFDYTHIRPAGVPIKGFGGTSQGPEILESMHNSIAEVLGSLGGKQLTVTAIVDVMNLIGKCVVSGNVRRTAEIAFGDPHSEEYISLKDYKVNPHRQAYGWTSNNSVFATLGMDYKNVCDKVVVNGEVNTYPVTCG
jgi:ribonucleoside-triphosphate reductase (thioredoxin)